MTKKKVIIIGLLLLFISTGLVVGLNLKKSKTDAAPQSAAERVIRVVTLQNADEGLFLKDFAEEKGFFAERNLKIENISVEKNGGDLLLKGAGDVYLGGIGGTLNGFLNGLDFKWIATTTTHPYNLGAVSRYPRGEEQKIKKVTITTPGGANELQVRDALKRIGVDDSKVEFVITPIASRAALLDAGEIDFTVVDLDMSGKSEASKIFEKYTIYSPIEAFTSGVAVRGISTTKDIMALKDAELRDFVGSIQEALIYSDAHPEEVIAFLQNKYEFSQQNAVKFHANYAEARKGADIVPKVDMIADAVMIMKAKFKLSQQDRNIDDFESIGYAEAAMSK